MNTEYPETFEVEIDNDAMLKYLRVRQIFITLCISFLYAIIPTIIFGIICIVDPIYDSFIENILLLLTKVAQYFCLVLSVGIITYFGFIKWYLKYMVKNLMLQIDGAYFVYNEGIIFKSEHKIHFRSITDYSVHRNLLTQFMNVGTLKMTMLGSGKNSILTFLGVKNAEKIRDMLAEIDAQRENK